MGENCVPHFPGRIVSYGNVKDEKKIPEYGKMHLELVISSWEVGSALGEVVSQRKQVGGVCCLSRGRHLWAAWAYCLHGLPVQACELICPGPDLCFGCVCWGAGRVTQGGGSCIEQLGGLGRLGEPVLCQETWLLSGLRRFEWAKAPCPG